MNAAKSEGVYLDRLRGNTALALAEGASLPQVLAHIVSVTRGHNRPTGEDHVDGLELAEHADALNTFRATPPGEVAAEHG